MQEDLEKGRIQNKKILGLEGCEKQKKKRKEEKVVKKIKRKQE